MNQYIEKPSNYLLKKLSLFIENPWFAYITIVLLQLKRVWNAWLYKDLTFGDTSFYFISAFRWVQEFSVNIYWSPLYTAYYGTILKIFPDIYAATLIHRIIILCLLAITILTLMRRLLPPYISWWVSAWWVVLPINFNALYEVHLFAIFPPLAATLVVLYKTTSWTRGAALGILVASTVLVRNEISTAVILWGVTCLIWEFKKWKTININFLLLSYGIPLLIAGLLISFFIWHSPVKLSKENLNQKHTFNLCQIYGFGYKQRHPEWDKNAWTECQEVMFQLFGKPNPTLPEALAANPNAMIEHFLWNLRLSPASLQISLFNATSDHVNPDYIPVLMEKKLY